MWVVQRPSRGHRVYRAGAPVTDMTFEPAADMRYQELGTVVKNRHSACSECSVPSVVSACRATSSWIRKSLHPLQHRS